MKKKQFLKRIGDFMAGKGFYIVLFLCVAAIGISGYYLLSGLELGGTTAVAGGAQVVVSPSPTVTLPQVKVTPTPTPAPTHKPAATPTPTSAPTQTPAPTAAPKRTVYTWPVKGEVIYDFSLEVLAYDPTMGDWRTHSGIDIAAEQGVSVLAITGGTVESVTQDDLMGTTVTIDHGNGLKSYYANLAVTPTVSTGNNVATGAVIGAVGNTAIAEIERPSHLHFEIIKDGESVDPLQYLP